MQCTIGDTLKYDGSKVQIFVLNHGKIKSPVCCIDLFGKLTTWQQNSPFTHLKPINDIYYINQNLKQEH